MVIYFKGVDYLIDYVGLERVLRAHKKNKKYLHEELGLSKDTIAKFAKGQSVSLSTLERICLHFGCKIEDIVEIKKDQ